MRKAFATNVFIRKHATLLLCYDLIWHDILSSPSLNPGQLGSLRISSSRGSRWVQGPFKRRREYPRKSKGLLLQSLLAFAFESTGCFKMVYLIFPKQTTALSFMADSNRTSTWWNFFIYLSHSFYLPLLSISFMSILMRASTLILTGCRPYEIELNIVTFNNAKKFNLPFINLSITTKIRTAFAVLVGFVVEEFNLSCSRLYHIF